MIADLCALSRLGADLAAQRVARWQLEDDTDRQLLDGRVQRQRVAQHDAIWTARQANREQAQDQYGTDRRRAQTATRSCAARVQVSR